MKWNGMGEHALFEQAFFDWSCTMHHPSRSIIWRIDGKLRKSLQQNCEARLLLTGVRAVTGAVYLL